MRFSSETREFCFPIFAGWRIFFERHPNRPTHRPLYEVSAKTAAVGRITTKQPVQGVSPILKTQAQATIGSLLLLHGNRHPTPPPHDILWPKK